jgi:hypothetical protein
MKLAPVVLFAVSSLAVHIGSAAAGPCTMEIDHLQKTLSYNNVGISRVGAPTGRISNSVGDENRIVNSVGIENRIGPTVPVTVTTAVNSNAGTRTPSANGSSAPLIPAPGQQIGVPTYNTTSNTPSAPTTSPSSVAADALSRAREFDRAGRELDCQSEVDRASSAMNNL